MSKLLFSLFFASALLLGFTSASCNLTCDNLQYIAVTLTALSNDPFQISSISLSTYSIPSGVSNACSYISSFAELDSESRNAAASSLTDQTQGGTVANKVNRNRKFRTRGGRNNKQTAYSAIYSSFLEIDFDTGIDSDIDTDIDTDTAADSGIDTDTNTNTAATTRSTRSTKRFGRSYEKTKSVTASDVVNAIQFGICFVNTYGNYSSYVLTDAQWYCTHDLRAYFQGTTFPKYGSGDYTADRGDWLSDASSFYGGDAYYVLNCTF